MNDIPINLFEKKTLLTLKTTSDMMQSTLALGSRMLEPGPAPPPVCAVLLGK